jgi:mRNA interferase MazF
VVLVPFPFTDLSGRKRRPALVVSPEGFSEEDLVLCAITSRVPEFSDDEGRTYATLSLRAGQLMVLHHRPVEVA